MNRPNGQGTGPRRGAAGAPCLSSQVERLLELPLPLPIVQAGHPALRATARPYDGELDDAVFTALIDAMRVTMHAAPGVGLAAPQLGLSLAIAVAEDAGAPDESALDARERFPLPFRVLVNPTYEPVGEDAVFAYEGCLSISGWQAVVRRSRSVRLRGQDGDGQEVDEVLHGWPARIVAHETDHLHGTLYLDRAHTRSLSSTEQLARRWAGEAIPETAARVLGFPLN